MKQQKLAGRLKLLAILIGIIGILFFGGAIALHIHMQTGILPTVFTGAAAILCYAILYQFWKVCVEIGNDNSFSLENAAAFRKMCILALILGASYLVRGVCYFAIGKMQPEILLYILFMLALSGIFAGLCDALSQLVKNAYEVKQETELTI